MAKSSGWFRQICSMPADRRRHRGHRRSRGRRRDDDDRDGGEDDGASDSERRIDTVTQSRACDPEWLTRMRDYLGEPNMNRTRCFLCRAARHDSALIQMKPWNDMAEIYRKGQLETDPIANAYTLSRHFETEIRQPANSKLKRDQRPIPELRAVDIFWHFKMHILEATNEVYNTIRDIKETETLLFGTLRKAIIKADGRPGFAARKKIIPLLKTVWAEKRQWLSLRPDRMAFYNPVYGLNVADVSAFANKNQKWEQINVEDYLGKELAKRARVQGAPSDAKK